MIYIFMFIVPVLGYIWWTLTWGDPGYSLALWIGIASLFATIDSYLFATKIFPKIQANKTQNPEWVNMSAPPTEASISMTLWVYIMSVFLFGSVIFFTHMTTTNPPVNTKTSSWEIAATGWLENLAPPETKDVPENAKESMPNVETWTLENTGTLEKDIGGEDSHTWKDLATIEDVRMVIEEQKRVEERQITEEEEDTTIYWSTSLDGDAGIADLIAGWYIRVATNEDHTVWLDAIIENPESYITKKIGYPVNTSDKKTITQAFIHSTYGKNFYVAKNNFTLPSGMYWKYNFYIPKGIKKPKGDISNGTLYDFNTLSCGNCYMDIEWLSINSRNSQKAPKDENMTYLAWGWYGWVETSLKIDTSNHKTTLFDVFVNSTEKPVTLILGAYEPTVWTLHITKWTTIKKVILWGYHGQEIIVPTQDIEIEKHVYQYGNQDFFYIAKWSTLVSSLQKYGDIDEITYDNGRGTITLGDPAPIGAEWITNTTKNPADFSR